MPAAVQGNGSELKDDSLKGIRILIVFHSFRQDQDTFAFLTDVRNLGAIPAMNLLHVSACLKAAGAEVVSSNIAR